MRFDGNYEIRMLMQNARGGDRLARVLSPMSFVDSSDLVWNLSVGFILDGSSFPQAWQIPIPIVRSFVAGAIQYFLGGPFEGDFRAGGAFHDQAYWEQSRTREQADAMYRDAALFCGASERVADLAYYALRKFGQRAWDEDARLKEEFEFRFAHERERYEQRILDLQRLL